MSYTADGIAAIRQIGSLYTAQILRGAKPADLPVQQPTKFNLVINQSYCQGARPCGAAIDSPACRRGDRLVDRSAAGLGHERQIDDVRDASGVPPIASELVHRSNNGPGYKRSSFDRGWTTSGLTNILLG